MIVRPYRDDDVEAIAAIFVDTIHRINARDYSPEQLAAWAPLEPPDLSRWRAKFARSEAFVCDADGVVVGFVNWDRPDHLDCLYVHADHQGEGIGRRLTAMVEHRAAELGGRELFVEASITARGFFERQGFEVIAAQEVSIRNVNLKNFRMRKLLQMGGRSSC